MHIVGSTLLETHADGVAKDEVSHHGVADKDHATDEAEVDKIRASQSQGAGDHPQAGLEVHTLQHPPNQQQDVDAIQCIVPRQLVHQVLHIGKKMRFLIRAKVAVT